MVSASKILTVSYGTFSCTLEGFDDPFSTMRAIAEYFRDLAAEDRFFGAEPPTPDAEMLHRIAEREVRRRVTAEVHGNGVVLRQAAAPEADLAPAPAPVPAPARHDVEAPVESVAARLQRLRAAMARGAAIAAPVGATIDHVAPPTVWPDPEAAGDAVIADRADPARLPTDPPDTALDDHFDDEAPATPDAEAGAKVPAPATRTVEAISEAVSEAVSDDDMIAAALASPKAVAPEAAPEPQAAEAEPGAAPEPDVDDETLHERPRARVLKVARTSPLVAPEAAGEHDDAAAEATADDARDEAHENTDDDTHDEAAPTAPWATASTLSPDDEADLRAELAAAIEEAGPDAGRDAAPRPTRTEAPEPDEAAVARLLEQTNTELAVPEQRRRHSAIEHLRAAVAATRADRRARRDREGGAPEADLEAERADRFHTDLAHTVRPHRPGPALPAPARAATPRPAVRRQPPLVLVSAQRIDAPRPDGGSFPVRPVRPRRVGGSGNLALDTSAEDEGAPENLLADAVTFAAFAARIGVSELPELLEAAAVHCIHIDKRDGFTRPMLMRKLSEMPGAVAPTREDGLRAFGQLLREGRLEKLRRGHYGLVDGSQFEAMARRMAEE